MRHTVEFVLFPDAVGLDITGPLEVFNTATVLMERGGQTGAGYMARYTAINKGPVRLSSGLEVMADTDFEDTVPPDILLVPGGTGVENALRKPGFVEAIRERSRQAKRILSVCNGAFFLAAAGLLDGRRATTHWRTADDLAQRYPQVEVMPDAIYIRDGHIYTSAGVTAGIDLALAVVEEDFGATLALEVSRMLVLYFRRPGTQSQFSAPLKTQAAAGKRFAKLHDWLVGNLSHPVSVEQMAAFTAMSPRNFARVFKARTGMTPNKFLETMRLDRARELLAAGNDSLEHIAEACGFGREERLRRAFLRRFQVTPSQFRLHFTPS
ncbi:MAG: GlxA family transcriptional regulator [Desulfobacterales bacterium]|nr:GlxA family transcriptional regulator [Desulfobacterales bacterium]